MFQKDYTDVVTFGSLMALSARVAAAPGPDKELDEAIAVALWKLTPNKRTDEEGETRIYKWLHPNGRHIGGFYVSAQTGPMENYGGDDEWGGYVGWDVFNIPPFTGARDAAIYVIPEGWASRVENWPRPAGQTDELHTGKNCKAVLMQCMMKKIGHNEIWGYHAPGSFMVEEFADTEPLAVVAAALKAQALLLVDL